MLPDLKEGGLQTFVGERLDDRHGVLWPRTVVEGQHDLLVAEEIVLLEVLEAEARAAGGVDFDNARKAHPTRFVAGRYGGRRRSGCSGPGWFWLAGFCAGAVWATRIGAALEGCASPGADTVPVVFGAANSELCRLRELTERLTAPELSFRLMRAG